MALSPRTLDLAEELGYDTGKKIADGELKADEAVNPYSGYDHAARWRLGYERAQAEATQARGRRSRKS